MKLAVTNSLFGDIHTNIWDKVPYWIVLHFDVLVQLYDDLILSTELVVEGTNET